MSSQDLHQVILRWPYTDANEVIVTGTFDKWSSSLRLARKPDGFEAPIFIPWKDKIAYKFIVDGRWMTNNTEPTEIDHGYVNNVYTAPPKPPPQESKPIPAQPSHPSESQVEPDHAEKLPEEHVANGFALDKPHDVDTSAAEPKPAGSSSLVEEVKTVVTPAVESPQAAVAQVAPDPKEVEKVSDEIAPETQAPEEPIPTALSPAHPSPEQERPTHVADGSAPAVVAQVEPATQDSGVAQVNRPTEEVAALPAEKGVPSLTSEADPPKEDEEVKAPVEPEPASAAAEPETVPVTEVPADDVTTTIPEEPEPVVSPDPVPAVEQKSPPTESQPPIPAAVAPEPKLDEKSSDDAVPTTPPVNGHTKSTSTASTSTAVPTLPTTPKRKASRKFSFPGRDKSGNSSPTGSSRFSSQQKREKRHSLLGKLKEIFGDKEKKEKSAKA